MSFDYLTERDVDKERQVEIDKLRAMIESRDYKISAIEKELARLRGLPNLARMEQIAVENEGLHDWMKQAAEMEADRDDLRRFVEWVAREYVEEVAGKEARRVLGDLAMHRRNSG